MLSFFSTTLILPLISRSWLGSSVSFSPRSPGQPVWLLFSLTPIQTLDDRGWGRFFISFTFSGPNDSLINSKIMRLNVSSPRLVFFSVHLCERSFVDAAGLVAASVRVAIESEQLLGYHLFFCSIKYCYYFSSHMLWLNNNNIEIYLAWVSYVVIFRYNNEMLPFISGKGRESRVAALPASARLPDPVVQCLHTLL